LRERYEPRKLQFLGSPTLDREGKMISNASLNAQAVDSDGRNWTLTIGHDGATALYRTGERIASLDAESAVAILTGFSSANERVEQLLGRLEQASEPIDERAREVLLNSASWVGVHWG
jgi:hypothetical protein